MLSLKRLLPLAAVTLFATQAHAYRLLIDYNTFMVSDGISNTPALSCDGVYNIPISPNSDLTISQWQTVYNYNNPNSSGWYISEDNPPPNNVGTELHASYDNVKAITGRVDDGLCYNETGSTPGGTLLSNSQITDAASSHGGHVVVLTRGYSTNTSDAWYTNVERCLANSSVSGVAMETVSSYSGYACDLLASRVINVYHKRVYFMLNAYNDAYVASSINYLKAKQPTVMQNSNVFIVVARYQSPSQGAYPPWFGNDVNTAQGTLSLEKQMNGVSGGAVADNLYRINNWHSGFSLTETGTGNLAAVDQIAYSGASSQQWYLTYNGSGRYSFVNSESLRALDVQSGSTAAGASLIMYACDVPTGNTDQVFSFTAQTNGSDNFKAVCSGLSLEPSGGSQSSGEDIVQEPYTTATYQDWTFSAP